MVEEKEKTKEGLENGLIDYLEKLRPREEKIIRMRYGHGEKRPHSLGEIGKVFGISRERVRQIIWKSLHKLKEAKRTEQALKGIESLPLRDRS